MRPPDYAGGGLVNAVAELEHRLVGRCAGPRLDPALAAAVPEADTFVLVMFDGLGDGQLAHPAAARLAGFRVGAIDASFPTTTTVSLASMATGLPPARHGLLGYQLWLPEVDRVVNTIKWTTLWGEAIPHDYAGFLPQPNTWERMAAGGGEAIALQPADFEGTPLTRVLYRGARFEGYVDEPDAVEAAATLARRPGRLIVLYLPHVDYAAHVWGQDSDGYRRALTAVSEIWERLLLSLPPGAVAVGIADHGHVDVPSERRVSIPKPDHEDRVFSGDGRVMFVHGEGASLADTLPASWVDRGEMAGWWGPGPRHPAFDVRAPDGALLADDGCALLHRFSDDRLIGQHGGLTEAELRVPLLVGVGR